MSRPKGSSQIVNYAGLTHRANRSGKLEAKGLPITKAGSSYLRRALWLAAAAMFLSSKSSVERSDYRGKPYRVAVAAVARKLCLIIFAVMRDKVAYNPN